MSFYDYESRMERPLNIKIPELQSGDRLKHIIFAAQYSPPLLERLSATADRIRVLAKSKPGHQFLNSLLPHRRAMLYFTQPSTRTFLSFSAACQILGIVCNEVRDPNVSSETKGESPFDSVRMFSSYFDVVIMRSKMANFAECCAYMMNDLESTSRRAVPIVNGGSGTDEHPTQALLDFYTIRRATRYTRPGNPDWLAELRESEPELTTGVANKTFGFCGDIGRGRTIRSLVQLLSMYEGTKLYFVAPDHETLKLPEALKTRLEATGVTVREFASFDDVVDGKPVIEQLDCLYMTRIQKEHNDPQTANPFADIDFDGYKLSRKRVAQMKQSAIILHPFPRDENFGEIPPEIDRDHRAFYFRQARNGMWTRAALLAHLFDSDGAIASFYDEFTAG